MRKISIAFEKPQIEINGVVYDVLKSDKAIVEDMIDIDHQFAGWDMASTETVLEKNGVLLEYLERLLGAGATDKIISSIPGMEEYGLGLAGLDGFLGQIVQAAGRAYSDGIKIKYDD